MAKKYFSEIYYRDSLIEFLEVNDRHFTYHGFKFEEIAQIYEAFRKEIEREEKKN